MGSRISGIWICVDIEDKIVHIKISVFWLYVKYKVVMRVGARSAHSIFFSKAG